jgi:hypothetical protein
MTTLVEHLKMTLDGSKWSVSRPGRFTLGTHWIGGCVGLKVGLDAKKKRKNVVSTRDRTPAVQPVTRRNAEWWKSLK